MKILTTGLAAALAVMMAAGGAQAAGDAAKGEKVFKRCKACHKLNGKNGVGPHLDGVVGRPVASVEGFKYSKAMVAWGEGKTWDEATLTEYLAAPKKVVKGTKMSFAGLKKPEQIADVIAYIESAK